jgi:hypothetical protein
LKEHGPPQGDPHCSAVWFRRSLFSHGQKIVGEGGGWDKRMFCIELVEHRQTNLAPTGLDSGQAARIPAGARGDRFYSILPSCHNHAS